MTSRRSSAKVLRVSVKSHDEVRKAFESNTLVRERYNKG
jgi:hypothetical protein